jgi:hypothetical protein
MRAAISIGSAVALAFALAACVSVGVSERGVPSVRVTPPAWSAALDYTREGKPQFGEAASALISANRLTITLLVAEGQTDTVDYSLTPGIDLPPGAVAALGLSGAGWRMHTLGLQKAAASGQNGLCASKTPELVFIRQEPGGSRQLAGYIAPPGGAMSPTGLCPMLRFLP